MSDNLTALLIVICCTLGPVWIFFNYLAKSRNVRQLNGADAAALSQMVKNLQVVENRVATLERILDAELPGWRQTSDLGAHNHATI